MRIFYLFFLLFGSLVFTSIKAQTPTLSCPGNTIVPNNPGTCGAVIVYPIPTCAANCTGAVIYQSDNTGYTSGDHFDVGTYFVEYTISNGSDSSSCTFKIEVQDVEDPTLSLPTTLGVYVNSNCEYVLPYLPLEGIGTFSDNCKLDTVFQTPAAGTILSGAGSSVLINFVVEDSTGNQATGSLTLNLLDTLAPVISNCPGTITEPVTSGCNAVLQNYIALVNVNDNCDNNPVITQVPASGTAFTTSQDVTIYAEDITGNIDSCTFTVVSNDITAPTITCPSDTTVGVNSSCEFLVPDFGALASATDNCDPNVTFSQSPAIGSKLTGSNASYFVSITGSDIAGNSSVCSFEVTLIDTLAPTFDNCKDTVLYLNHDCELIVPNMASFVGVNENCSSFTTTQIPAAGTVISGQTSTTLYYIATDLASNSATCSLEIITADSTKPNIAACPSDMTVNTSASSCDYVVVDFGPSVFATDNCSSVFNIVQSEAVGTPLAAGSTYPITLTVSDDAGNFSTCSFDITVEDNVGPNLICPANPQVMVNNNCEYVIPSYDTVVMPTDNCGNVTMTQTPAPGTILTGVGTQQSISLFAQDTEGNQSSCSFMITLADTTSPTVTCPGDQLVTINSNCQYQIPDLSSLVTFSDFCDASPSYSQSPMLGTTVTGVVNINVTITDASGNNSTCVVTARPDDNIPPTINCPGDMASCSSIFTYNTPTGSDNCGLVTITQTDLTGLSSGDSFPVGISTLEYTATDDVGNTTSCSFNVEVYPTPSISFTGEYAINEGDSIQIIANVTDDSTFTWSPIYNMEGDSTLTPWVSPGTTVTYTLSVTSEHGCEAEGEITVSVEQIVELIINNFLSPNNDGKNDFWTMSKPALISGCNVSIYDRWGKRVWESNAYNNQWDGKNTQGDELPDGTYFYQITCEGDEPLKGSILLMR